MDNVIEAPSTEQNMVRRTEALLRESRRGCGSAQGDRRIARLRRFIYAKYRQEHEAGQDNGWIELVLEDHEYQMADDH